MLNFPPVIMAAASDYGLESSFALLRKCSHDYEETVDNRQPQM
jgi:hypothetical protein